MASLKATSGPMLEPTAVFVHMRDKQVEGWSPGRLAPETYVGPRLRPSLLGDRTIAAQGPQSYPDRP